MSAWAFWPACVGRNECLASEFQARAGPAARGSSPWPAPLRQVSAPPAAAPPEPSSPPARCPRCASPDGSRSPPQAPGHASPCRTARPISQTTPGPRSSPGFSRSQKPCQNRRGLLPVPRFFFQLLLARARQLVKFRFPVVIRNAPLRRDEPFLFQLQQRRIQRSIIHRQQIAAGLLDPPRNPVPVHRPHSLQRLEHHQRQRALPHIRFVVTHVRSYGIPIDILAQALWESNRE